MVTYSIASFYKFVRLTNLDDRKLSLHNQAENLDLKGTILLAEEGINAMISGSPDLVTSFLVALQSQTEFADLAVKTALTEIPPFQKLKIKVKKEIISFKEPCNPAEIAGTHVLAKDWNKLLSDPEVTVIDVRNHYEVSEGMFPGAKNPNLKSFSAFRSFARENLNPSKNRKIAMYCTGGIRCEKASSYLLSLGFEQVMQLEGGIIRYLQDIPPSENKFCGRNFVFDERGTAS